MDPTKFHLGHCKPCGKATYETRKAARQALHRYHPGAKNSSAYECPHTAGRWHYGRRPDGGRALIRYRRGERAS